MTYNLPMDTKTSFTSKTYFGFTALLAGIISDAFLAANFGVAYLEITPGIFNQLNNWTALLFCILTPLTVALGVMGFLRKRDSKTLSVIALTLVTIPVLVLVSQFISSFLRH